MQKIVTICAVIMLGLGCSEPGLHQAAVKPRPPLADTLVSIFQQMKVAATSNQGDKFLQLLDSSEADRLGELTHQHGFSSLRTYVERQFVNWPDPDTLILSDFTLEPPYARLTLAGWAVGQKANLKEVRYTFMLFRRQALDWKLVAMSSLDKARFDPYGVEISYLETELPPRLRFPRRF